jgi:PAS domain S-box-containing protein
MTTQKNTAPGNPSGRALGPGMLRSTGGIALLYFLISLASVGASAGIGETALLSPANGFLLAMLLCCRDVSRVRLLLLCLAGSVAANRLGSKPFLAAYGLAAANLAEVLFAEFLIGRLRIGSDILTGIRKTFLFQGVVAGSAAAVSAFIVAGLMAYGSRAPFLETLLTRWTVDALGLVVVTPAVLSWFGPDPAWEKNRHRVPELILCAAFTLGFTCAIFLLSKSLWGPFGHPLPQAVLPFLLWAALRFGAKGTVNLSLAVYCLAGWFTALGLGPIADMHHSPLAMLGALLIFQMVIALCTMIPAILINSQLAVLEKLRDRDFRYNNLWTSTLVGIYVADLKGVVREANDTFLTMIGYSRGEMEAGDVQMLNLATTEYKADAEVRKSRFLKEGQMGPFEREWVLRDGGRFRGVVFATKMEADMAMCMVLDISELIRAQQELRRSEDLFASLMDSDIIGVAILNQDAVFEAANAAYLSIIGYDKEDVAAGRLKASMLFAAGTEQQYTDLGELLRTFGRMEPAEARYRHKSGASIPVYRGITRIEESGRFVVVAMDLTRMKEVQTALRRSEQLFRSLTEVSLVGTLRLDMQGECTYANPKWLSMAGITEKELGSRGWRHAIHEDDRAELNAAWDAFLAGGPPVMRDYRLRKPDGTLTWVSSWSTDLKDTDGSRIGFLEKTIDITEHMRAKAELESAIKAAEAANEAKSRFLAHMSHEIRTPLNGVLGMLSLLGETPLSPQQKEYSSVAKQSGEHLLSLIDQVLDFSKIEGRHLRLDEIGFGLSEVLEGTLSSVAGMAANKGLEVLADRDPELPERFVGDPMRLRQILFNLAGNAVKFSDRGEIRISVRMLAESGNATQLLFEVSDEGPGIAPEVIRDLFQPFRQGDASLSRKAGGTGLGLAISKDLVSLMGGKIWVENGPRTGCTFRFTVLLRKSAGPGNLGDTLSGTVGADGEAPRDLRAPGTGARRETGSVDWGDAGPRILLVDDHPTNLLVASAMLGKLGCAVDTAMDGGSALKALREKRYDMVLMDCQMPGLDGFQTTARIREMPGPIGRIPIIALTAQAVAGVRERCLSAGMDDYISKPFTRERLRDALLNWIGFLAPKPETPQAAVPAFAVASAPGEGVDWSRLDALDGGTREAKQSIRALTELFLETSENDLLALRSLVAEGRERDMTRLLHRMKGACGTVGASALAALAAEMEACLAGRDLAALPGMADRLGAELSRAGGMLRKRLREP